jgi:uncharacterized protein YqgV (UPF0045/DUF77 family)
MVELSVQVQNKLSVADKVIASARTHGPKVAAIIAERAKAVQGPATKATVEAVGAVIDAVADNVAYANAILRDAEIKYFGEKADDPPIRAARDNSVVDIAGMLAQLRTHIEGTLGASAPNKYGLTGDIPRTPHKLVSYTQNVTKQLDQYPQQVTTALGVSFNTAPASTALKSKLNELVALVNDDNREARELEEAQMERNRAAVAWSDAYQGAASTFEGLYRTAGYAELADRVRPTQRKVRGEDPGDDTTAPPAPPAGTEGP